MRLPVVEPDAVTARQQQISERIAGRRGAVRGPFQVWIQSPELCDRVEALGAFVRFESSLPPRLRELSLLLAARQWDAQYSWNAHAGKAEAGIPIAAIEAIARMAVGPLVSRSHRDGVLRDIAAAVDQGTRVSLGGAAPGGSLANFGR